MTAEELLARIPEPYRADAMKYTAALASMAADELVAWVDLLLKGDYREATRTAVQRLTPVQRLEMCGGDLESWAKHNRVNAETIAAEREAALWAVKAVLAVALAAAGL